MIRTENLRIARPKRPPCLLVCAKCVRKADDGKAIKKALKAELGKRGTRTGRRPGKLIETKCLGVCPKQALTLASGATLVRGEMLVVKSAADVPDALDSLLSSFQTERSGDPEPGCVDAVR